jgi:hypothetical protein
MEIGIVIGIAGIFLTVLIQTVGIVWYFSRLNSRVEALESIAADAKGGKGAERLLKLEFLMEVLQTSTDQQALKLDKVIDGQARAEAERHVLLTALKIDKEAFHENTNN